MRHGDGDVASIVMIRRTRGSGEAVLAPQNSMLLTLWKYWCFRADAGSRAKRLLRYRQSHLRCHRLVC
jgi:hypothetical protein